MNEQIKPLAASVRASDDDYPGVVAQLGPDWRLAVSMNADRYSLHQRVQTDEGFAWVPAGGSSPKTLAKILAKYGERVEGLAAVCAGLPDDPAAAASLFAARRQVQLSDLERRDMFRADYARVVARQGQLRLAVDPDGLRYVLQWVRVADARRPDVRWRRVWDAPTLSEVWAFVRDNVAGLDGPGVAGRVRGDDLLPRWQAFVAGLPERADAGGWSFVPAMPGRAPGSLQA